MGPYGEAAWIYRHAGWAGVLPLPAAAKDPVPRGFTGWAGVDPSGADVQAWLDGGRADGNIALRLPRGVYGLDVDDYAGKTGGAALAHLVAAYGPLPPTWIVSSREDSISGIRFFRADHGDGRKWRDEPGGHGAGIEAIHFGHRYAVVWPSLHPDIGRKYTWRGPDGAVVADGIVPALAELPALPDAWAAGLSELGEIRTGEMAGHGEAVELVGGWRSGDPCARVITAHERAVGGLSAAAAGAALHPAAVAGLHELINLGHEGHAGVRRFLAEHYSMFIEVRMVRASTAGDTRGPAEGEWWRMVRGAIGKLPASTRREVCDCDLWSGSGLLFDPFPGSDMAVTSEFPTDSEALDTPGQVALDPVDAMLAELLSPAQLAERPNPVPVVAGLLYMDTLAWLIGKSGSFKSFVALDLAAHVAGGLAWNSRRTITGPVLYVAAEGGGGLGMRVRAWGSVRGEMTGPLHVLPRPVQVRGPEWAVLVELVRRLRPVLIILDTQARITVGVKENDNTEMGAFIEQADRLRRAAGSCVLLVHHIGRNGDDARGASSLDGAQDTELKVERVGGAKALKARLIVDKQKDGPDTEQIDFNLQSVDLGPDPATGLPTSSLVAVAAEFADPFPAAPWREGLAENQALVLQIMVEQFSERGGTRAEIASVLREQGQRGGPKYVRSSFYYAWDQLLKKDRIEPLAGTQRFVLSAHLDAK